MQNDRGSHAIPGALGLGQATATAISNGFFVFLFLTPLGFALVSDIWLGRYKTLLLGLSLSLCGSLVMFTTSLPAALDRGAGVPGLAMAMILIGLGVGATKATVSPFIGELRKPASCVLISVSKSSKAISTPRRVPSLSGKVMGGSSSWTAHEHCNSYTMLSTGSRTLLPSPPFPQRSWSETSTFGRRTSWLPPPWSLHQAFSSCSVQNWVRRWLEPLCR